LKKALEGTEVLGKFTNREFDFHLFRELLDWPIGASLQSAEEVQGG